MNEITKPECRLTGTGGNVFCIIGNASRALKKSGQRARAEEWVKAAMACGSYDEVLRLCHEYVDVL